MVIVEVQKAEVQFLRAKMLDVSRAMALGRNCLRCDTELQDKKFDSWKGPCRKLITRTDIILELHSWLFYPKVNSEKHCPLAKCHTT